MSWEVTAPVSVCIIGCQRSGTTMSGHILGAHSKALLIDETDGLYPWVKSLGADGAAAFPALPETMLAAVLQKYRHSGDWRQEPNAVEAVPSQASHLVLKAPNLTYGVTDYVERAGPCRLIAPIRDPRAVVASILNQTTIPMVANQARLLRNSAFATVYADELARLDDETIPAFEAAAWVWRIKNEIAEQAVENAGQGLRLKYEDLASGEETALEALFAAAGLDRGLARPHWDVLSGVGPGSGNARNRPLDTTRIEAWRERFDRVEAERIIEIAGPLAQRYGYA